MYLLVGGVEVEDDAVMAHEFNIYFPTVHSKNNRKFLYQKCVIYIPIYINNALEMKQWE